ncbi:VOC family protein [Clostridium celatum]|uniref:Glyoxalase family protein n=1 Tax=Clostridium celatum DSM 1785 TaxID=545697 RepID=L1QFC1_9CLOT|nr:VOC family protein [Clostridium celatum]EKY26694.1 glyoxalase family protein [Clostridium celatum DSM 1785]MCE9653764.1 VOC family protein [Clostridium celatum]MDU6296167.1 VOC family protein [Clostridium celatum]
MKLNKVHHVAIIASNYEVSKNFYTKVLGLEVIREVYRKERDSYKLDLKIGDSEIELFSFPNAPERLSYPEARGLRHLAFQVDNIDDAIASLNSNGIECEPIRVDEFTGKRFTFFEDPDNLPLELCEK